MISRQNCSRRCRSGTGDIEFQPDFRQRWSSKRAGVPAIPLPLQGKRFFYTSRPRAALARRACHWAGICQPFRLKIPCSCLIFIDGLTSIARSDRAHDYGLRTDLHEVRRSNAVHCRPEPRRLVPRPAQSRPSALVPRWVVTRFRQVAGTIGTRLVPSLLAGDTSEQGGVAPR